MILYPMALCLETGVRAKKFSVNRSSEPTHLSESFLLSLVSVRLHSHVFEDFIFFSVTLPV